MTGPRRTPLNRDRKARLDRATVELFRELEKTPMRERESAAFKARDKELAARLNLNYEWRCMIQSVLDREARPCYPEGYEAHRTWYRVRETRLQLLQACGLATESTARQAAALRRRRQGDTKLGRMFSL